MSHDFVLLPSHLEFTRILYCISYFIFLLICPSRDDLLAGRHPVLIQDIWMNAAGITQGNPATLTRGSLICRTGWRGWGWGWSGLNSHSELKTENTAVLIFKQFLGFR